MSAPTTTSATDAAASPSSTSQAAQRREQIAQALLEILTEGSPASSSDTSSVSTASYRALLVDFIELTNHEITQLRARIAALEFLHHRSYRTHEHS